MTGFAVYMAYTGWGLFTNTKSPMVVVLSNRTEKIDIGQICVFTLPGRDIPIVHRIMNRHDSNGRQQFLTKGDNNAMDDRKVIYQELHQNRDKHWIDRHEIVGCLQGFVPHLGWVTIWVSDYPLVKYALLAGVALLSLA
ncbi:Signal peptidase complex catalytic subunit [Mortierella sp. AD031]|nr:Signal peptidase complex catalytic subunit [Mortierella sp. AD031]